MSPDQLARLLDSWLIHLRAERKTTGTIKTYMDGARPYVQWCQAGGVDPLDRASLQTWTMELLEAGRSAATAKTRMMAVRHFTRWLADEGEIPEDPFARMRPPKVDEPVVPVLTSEQLRALVKACAAPTGEKTGLPALRHLRDEAIVRLLAETGMRASECLHLQVEDIDFTEGVLTIRRGKGGKGRMVSFGPDTTRALDRYQRVRALHRLADTPDFWLGDRGRRLAYPGLHWALAQRANAAGIPNFHPHVLRHTATHRWLAAGGSESGAMARHGWSSPDMLQRYGRANRERRAIEEARALNLGDLDS